MKGVKEEMFENVEQGGTFFSEKEEEYQELFQFFCNRISIRERENRRLQRSMLPLRFRKYMTEFMPK